MRRLFEALASDGRQRDFLVWGGVGDGSYLGAARALGARHALYIEPHPGLRGRLTSRHSLADNELLSEKPLWRTQGPAVFHVTNDAASSSLVPPAQGQGARRNIRVVEERPVQADSLDSALASLPADDHAGLLVLDTGGAVALILEGATPEALTRFDTIAVPASERARVGASLGGLGFDAGRAVHDENGREWTVFVATGSNESGEVKELRAELEFARSELDTLRLRLARLESELAAARAAHADAESASRAIEAQAVERLGAEHAQVMDELRAAHARAVEALQAEHARAVEALQAGHAQDIAALQAGQAQADQAVQAEHAARLAEVENRAAALEAERDAANAALAASSAEAEALRGQLAAAGEQSERMAAELASERDTQATRALDLQQKLTSLNAEAQQTIAALTGERDAANGALSQANAEIARLAPALEEANARVSELAARIAGLEQELVEARQVSTLSVKLQAQRDSDLADLQERYRESQAVQARQRELLEKLGARLSVASRYFHQLSDERGQAVTDDAGIADATLQADLDGER